jgi:leucyl aminopeptidase
LVSGPADWPHGPEIAADLALGASLRAYSFDRYKTKKGDDEEKDAPQTLSFGVEDPAAAKKAWKTRDAVARGVVTARDLVNEPPNVLHPEEFAKRAAELSELGVEVEILDEKQLSKIGMRALLGVGQGSTRESRVVVMRWNGAKKKGVAPVCFVGKGVCFDTGGISIKPAGGMEDMKGDMAGAACVVGLMQALAARKAKVDAVGLIGLVENMPDGNAIRPGDILHSASGQTIEVQNTDAEGRLVLCDVLWYAQENFKPKAIVDLATLTGAIIVSLGHHHAGMFTDSDDLAAELTAAGLAEGERVWRMPLGAEYDVQIKSKFADMRNIGGPAAGSITAAQFLKRFVKDGVKWAHLDIAGVAWVEGEKAPTDPSWASGYGPRLLNKWIMDNYE